MSLKDRLRRLEGRGGGCSECRNVSPSIRVIYPEEDHAPPEPERCAKCGRFVEVVVIRVVYEDLERGARLDA